MRFAPLLLAVAPVAAAQNPLHTFASGQDYDLFGHAVAGIGDVDLDGHADVAVGAYGWAPGRVHVYSGRTGQALYSVAGESLDKNSFGFSIAGLGDVDGDGVPDLVVGAPKHGVPGKYFGRIALLSGVDGALLGEVLGAGDQDWFGWSVASAGDVDGDGVADVIAGSPRDDGPGPEFGRVRVLSGRTGAVLHLFDGSVANGGFGSAVDGVGDLDGDGTGDVLVGAPGDTFQGQAGVGTVRVFSGRDGSVLLARGGTQGSEFGAAVSGAGDVDADGRADFLVGAPFHGAAGSERGQVRVFSGASGQVLYEYVGKADLDHLGWAVSEAGDPDGDGYADFAFSAPWPGAQYVRLVSGRSGKKIALLSGPPTFGEGLACAGDVDGDGLDDLLVGASQSTPYVLGSAYLFLGHAHDYVGEEYCSPAQPNSQGWSADVYATGSDVVDDQLLQVHAQRLPPQSTAVLLASETTALVSGAWGSEGDLCLGAPVLRVARPPQQCGSGGTLEWAVDLAAIPGYGAVLVGDTWHFQVWYTDQHPGPTSNFTDGVGVLFH